MILNILYFKMENKNNASWTRELARQKKEVKQLEHSRGKQKKIQVSDQHKVCAFLADMEKILSLFRKQ